MRDPTDGEPSTGGYTPCTLRPVRRVTPGHEEDSRAEARATGPRLRELPPPGNPKGSCGEKGGQELFDRLKALLRERGLEGRVMANRTYCLKHCSRGPVVAVQPNNVVGTPGVAAETSRNAGLEGGPPVERLFMPDVHAGVVSTRAQRGSSWAAARPVRP